jgi:hypothetical protein
MRKFPIIISMALGLLFLAAHPIHVSVTDVEFVPAKKELQVIVRIFTDDLEKQIRSEKNLPQLDILNPGNAQSSDTLFSDYLKQHLSFTVNGQKRAYKYIGFEEETGSVFNYLLIRGVDRLDKLDVRNDILFDIYDDQVNLVHVTIGEDIRTMKFVPGEELQSRTF